jgi:hypothetical protein
VIDWLFFAVWCVWLGWTGIAAVQWRPLSVTPVAIGMLLAVIHSLLVRRRITRLQDEILRHGLDDAETRRARAGFEERLLRLMGSLQPVFYASLVVSATIAVGAMFLSNMSMPRRTDIYAPRFSDGLIVLITVALLYFVGLSFAVSEVSVTLRKFFPEDQVPEPRDVDDRPTGLGLRPPNEPDEPRKT